RLRPRDRTCGARGRVGEAPQRSRSAEGIPGNMTILATIGAKGLYLLFAWLLSAAIGSWLSSRKGYGERVALTFWLLLSGVRVITVLLLPWGRGSAWREEGPLPKGLFRRHGSEGS